MVGSKKIKNKVQGCEVNTDDILHHGDKYRVLHVIYTYVLAKIMVNINVTGSRSTSQSQGCQTTQPLKWSISSLFTTRKQA